MTGQLDKTPIARMPHRPITGGTNNGVRPHRYDYWRTGYAADDGLLPFWIAQAGEYHCKPGYTTGEFEHGNRTQAYYHLRGEATFEHDGRVAAVQVGDFLLVPPQHPFRYHAAHGMRHHWFALEGEWPQVLGARQPQQIALGYDAEFDNLLIELREVLILQQPGSALRAMGVFHHLLARQQQLLGFANSNAAAYPDAVRNAMIILRENYADDFNAAATAAAVGVSPSHLRALFERWVGESPKRFHTHSRIDEARRLLVEQHYTVTEVAQRVGFNDAAHFSRVFKQFTGIAPRAYAAGG